MSATTHTVQHIYNVTSSRRTGVEEQNKQQKHFLPGGGRIFMGSQRAQLEIFIQEVKRLQTHVQSVLGMLIS